MPAHQAPDVEHSRIMQTATTGRLLVLDLGDIVGSGGGGLYYSLVYFFPFNHQSGLAHLHMVFQKQFPH